jgi:primosomal protein N'
LASASVEVRASAFLEKSMRVDKVPGDTQAGAGFASVIMTQSALAHLDRAFTYRVPEDLPVTVGARVRVPFRRRNREGVVVALLDEPDIERPLPLGAVLGPGLDADLVDLCRWVADQYLATLGEALAAALPDRVVDEETVDRLPGCAATTTASPSNAH